MERKIIWKFNIIDLLIIAAILVGGIFLIYRFVADNQKMSDFTFTYINDDAPSSLLEEIQPGEKIADGDTGRAIGTVKDCILNDDMGGTIYASVKGYDEEHGVSAGDSVFLKGHNKRLIIGDCIFNVYVMNIEKEGRNP